MPKAKPTPAPPPTEPPPVEEKPKKKKPIVVEIPPEENDSKMKENLSKYNFCYENLALEGGGAKCIGHIGVIKVKIISTVHISKSNSDGTNNYLKIS